MSNFANDPSQRFHYEAFISYRHKQPDAQIAKQLARALETYRLPHSLAKSKHMRHIGRVFRDQDELPTSSNLGADIEAALTASKWLIVICSPDLPLSQWCRKEIESFIAMGRRDRILALLVRGEPAESFPSSLRYIRNERGETIEIEPLAADIRADSVKEMTKKLRTEKLRLLAPMLGVAYDDLRRRARERRLRIIAAVTAGVAALSLGFGLFAVDRAQRIAAANAQLESQQVIISSQRDEALLSQSKFITELARDQYARGNREVASLALKEALPGNLSQPDRPFYADALGLLRRMELERGQVPFELVHLYDTNTYEVHMKPDGAISVWLQAEEPAKTAADRWSYPTDYHYLSPDGTVALEQVAYVPDDPDLPPPNSAHSYFEVRAFAYPSMQPLSTFRPFPEYSTVDPYVSGRYAVGVSQYEDSGVVVWDYTTGERVFTLDVCGVGDLAERQAQREANPVPGVLAQYEADADHGSNRVSEAFIREDGTVLVVDTRDADNNPLICGYDIRTGQRIWEVRSVNLWRHSRDGAHIAVYDWQGGNVTYTDEIKQARVYDTATGQQLLAVDGDPVREVAFGGPDNDLYVNAGGQYARYSLSGGAPEALCAALDNSVGLDVSPDGHTMLAEYVIDSKQHHYVYQRLPAGMRSFVHGIGGARSGDGQRVFVYAVGYQTVDVYSGKDFSPVTSFSLVPSADGLRDESPRVSYDGARLFFRGNVYDVDTGKVLCRIPQGTQVDGYQSDIGFSRDNRFFLTYVDTYNEIDDTVAELFDIRCYDAHTGAYLFSYGGKQLISVNAFSLAIRDGQLVLTDGFHDRGISYYDIATGKLIRRDLFPNNQRFSICDFSPDGSLVALTSWDAELSYDVLVLQTATGKRALMTHVAHVSESSSGMPVLFRDSRSFYAISGDSVVEIAVGGGAILRTVLTAPIDARLRASDFEVTSDDRTIFKSRMGDVWRLTDGAWYGFVPVTDSEKIIFGDAYIFNFGITASRWHERSDDAEHKPHLYLYHLRTDEAVFETMQEETRGKSLTQEERNTLFIP